MRLHLQRSVLASGWFGRKSIYRLAIMADIDAVERELIDAHDLHPVEIWASPQALAFDQEAERAFEQARDAASIWHWSFASSCKEIGLVHEGLHAVRDGHKEARVTIGDLVTGSVLEANEIRELMVAQIGIRDGFAHIEAALAALVAFEDGTTDVIDWPAPEDAGTPATDWFAARVRR